MNLEEAKKKLWGVVDRMGLQGDEESALYKILRELEGSPTFPELPKDTCQINIRVKFRGLDYTYNKVINEMNKQPAYMIIPIIDQTLDNLCSELIEKFAQDQRDKRGTSNDKSFQ